MFSRRVFEPGRVVCATACRARLAPNVGDTGSHCVVVDKTGTSKFDKANCKLKHQLTLSHSPKTRSTRRFIEMRLLRTVSSPNDV